MNEEEKEAIKDLEEMIELHEDDCLLTTEDDIKYIKVILNLVEKQEKEIEELKDKNKTLEMLLQGNLFEMYNYYKELANRYQANCISKDKIMKKIDLIDKEYAEIIEKNKNELYLVNINAQRHSAMQSILEELLGE